MLRKNSASGCPTNDFLGSGRHFLSPRFGCLRRKASFSTPTPDYNNNQSRLPLTRGPAPVFRGDTCFLLLAWPGRYGQTNWGHKQWKTAAKRGGKRHLVCGRARSFAGYPTRRSQPSSQGNTEEIAVDRGAVERISPAIDAGYRMIIHHPGSGECGRIAFECNSRRWQRREQLPGRQRDNKRPPSERCVTHTADGQEKRFTVERPAYATQAEAEANLCSAGYGDGHD